MVTSPFSPVKLSIQSQPLWCHNIINTRPEGPEPSQCLAMERVAERASPRGGASPWLLRRLLCCTGTLVLLQQLGDVKNGTLGVYPLVNHRKMEVLMGKPIGKP